MLNPWGSGPCLNMNRRGLRWTERDRSVRQVRFLGYNGLLILSLDLDGKQVIIPQSKRRLYVVMLGRNEDSVYDGSPWATNGQQVAL